MAERDFDAAWLCTKEIVLNAIENSIGQVPNRDLSYTLRFQRNHQNFVEMIFNCIGTGITEERLSKWVKELGLLESLNYISRMTGSGLGVITTDSDSQLTLFRYAYDASHHQAILTHHEKRQDGMVDGRPRGSRCEILLPIMPHSSFTILLNLWNEFIDRLILQSRNFSITFELIVGRDLVVDSPLSSSPGPSLTVRQERYDSRVGKGVLTLDNEDDNALQARLEDLYDTGPENSIITKSSTVAFGDDKSIRLSCCLFATKIESETIHNGAIDLEIWKFLRSVPLIDNASSSKNQPPCSLETWIESFTWNTYGQELVGNENKSLRRSRPCHLSSMVPLKLLLIVDLYATEDPLFTNLRKTSLFPQLGLHSACHRALATCLDQIKNIEGFGNVFNSSLEAKKNAIAKQNVPRIARDIVNMSQMAPKRLMERIHRVCADQTSIMTEKEHSDVVANLILRGILTHQNKNKINVDREENADVDDEEEPTDSTDKFDDFREEYGDDDLLSHY